ncbi:MAG: PAS domain-containing protein [Arsukibacterium sp.]|nr:PAS domain-containing protein [Arsukibacterium sp.]MDX1539033.1 PAS domain-containing protein [Arsukibacterium sp.]
MQPPEKPENEVQRLAALFGSALLDTEAEPRFDRITSLVQQCLGTEIVLISLVDKNRQWFKSRQGVAACETDRDISFCGHAILNDDIFEVSDAINDKRFADNPLVTTAPFIRFYAGAPLYFKGQRIGTLCIIDPKPRQLSELERRMLRQFADVIEQEITDRLQQQAHQQLAASELMYRSVLEGTRIGTWQWNVQTGETVFNERWADIVGYTLDELAPIDINTWLGLAHPDDLPESGRLLEQHFAGQLPFYDCKCRMKHKNGHWVWVHDRGRVISWTEDGKPLMMFGTHADITEQKEAELELKSSRDHFQNLLANIPGMVYQYQQWPDGHVAFPYASSNIQKIYGVSSEQVKQDATFLFDKIHKDDLADLANSIEKSAQNLTIWEHQYRVCQDKHQHSWLSGRATPERMPDGSTVWHGYIEDITTIKQYYLELERLNKEYKLSQQRLEMASETASIGFWQASLITGELWWSPVIYKIFGFDENITPSVALFKSTLHPDDRAVVAASEQRSLESGLHDVVHRIIRPDGSIRWVHELARLLPQDENPDQILVGSVQDVTEQMQLQQMKDAFISTVSHELRTPLTAIKGALALLNSGKLGHVPEKMLKLMHVADSNSERLAQLINDLLDVEKLAAGKMPFDIQSLAAQAELQQAVDNLQPFANQHHVVIELQPITERLMVQADSLRLQQVLTNLLSNAIKFSPPDTKVAVSIKRQNADVLFHITDYGSGIPAEFHSQIFQRFAQADGSNQRQSGGTGLGLAICKELVQQMGGSIGFNSTPGKGTTFYFALPAKPVTIN